MNQGQARWLRLAGFLFCSILTGQSRVIDCGSPSDVFFSGGLPYTIPGPTLPDQTVRFGNSFSYHLPASGDVTVKLTFFEPNQTTLGARIFSVSINDAPVIQNVDLVAASGGGLVPYTQTFPATARNGLIDIVFTTQVRSAVISSIEIVAAPVLPPVQAVDGETPAGTLNGTNLIFTLAFQPAASSLHLYRNGLRQKLGLDYTLSGNTITFLVAAVPQPGDTLLADYRR